MSPWSINRLGKAVRQGAVIACPTDTIWGFGCHPMRASAVAKILNIKQRPVGKGLILLSSRIEYCHPWIDPDLSDQQRALIKAEDLSPVTWLVPAAKNCPVWLRGDFDTIAIRITSHAFIEAICDEIQSPIVSTSANRSQRSPVRNALQVRRQFGDELDHIVTGFSSGTGRASRIKSLTTGETTRA